MKSSLENNLIEMKWKVEYKIYRELQNKVRSDPKYRIKYTVIDFV